MRPMLCDLWKDERGLLLVTEWVFVVTILILGILPTVMSVRNRMQQRSVQVNPSIELSTPSSCSIDVAN